MCSRAFELHFVKLRFSYCLIDFSICTCLITLFDYLGTGIIIQLGGEWRGKVHGLCGNFDDDSSNDFDNPATGLYYATANVFGDEWKTVASCPDADVPFEDPCELHVSAVSL